MRYILKFSTTTRETTINNTQKNWLKSVHQLVKPRSHHGLTINRAAERKIKNFFGKLLSAIVIRPQINKYFDKVM